MKEFFKRGRERERNEREKNGRVFGLIFMMAVFNYMYLRCQYNV